MAEPVCRSLRQRRARRLLKDIRKISGRSALAEHEKLLRQGEAECEDILSGSRRIADMEAKKSVLALKQEMVEAAFEAAKAYISELPREQYAEFLARMASEASENGTEELVLNASDKAELGKAVCKTANEKLAAAGKLGKLTLSEDTADISGGVIVRFGGIETNCSIDALVRQQRSALATEVAQVLFE